jgi:hypothetical protein
LTSNILIFRLDGVDYAFEAGQPDLSGKDVQRFT